LLQPSLRTQLQQQLLWFYRLKSIKPWQLSFVNGLVFGRCNNSVQNSAVAAAAVASSPATDSRFGCCFGVVGAASQLQVERRNNPFSLNTNFFFF
jgi:hypothetical protein